MGLAGGTANGGGDLVSEAHVVEMAVDNSSPSEISPLLVAESASQTSKMTIFSVSYPRKKRHENHVFLRAAFVFYPISKELMPSPAEKEITFLSQTISWMWSGSKHSGSLCVASSCIMYYIMEILMDIFPVCKIPLYQTVFVRCFILLIMSLLWLRRMSYAIIIPAPARNLLALRSITGFVSMLCFIYSVQHLPLSYAVMLNFTTPVMAFIGAIVILKEKSPLSHIGGLACSFLGLFFIFQPLLLMRGISNETSQTDRDLAFKEPSDIFPWLIGIFSSAMGGISYCFTHAGARASDQPAYAVFSFSVLACPLSAVCLLTFEELVLPNLTTSILMIVLGLLAFSAEILLARGLQLEKTTGVVNILYTKVLLSQAWSAVFLGTSPSFSKLFGCLLVLLSVCSTFYFGNEKENE